MTDCSEDSYLPNVPPVELFSPSIKSIPQTVRLRALLLHVPSVEFFLENFLVRSRQGCATD